MISIKFTTILNTLLLSLFLTSCLSFKKPESGGGSDFKNNYSEMPETTIEEKVIKSQALLRGKSVNLVPSATVKITGVNNQEKLKRTRIAIFGDGKDLLGSGPAPLLNNQVLDLKAKYKYFEITEKFENNVRRSKVKSNNHIIEYELSL